MISGVYIIKNIVNNKIYIGSSVDIHKRWKEHIRLLRNNKHKNKYLQDDWNKYGEHEFEFTIEEETVYLKKEVLEIEQKYLNLYKSFDKNTGYNVCKFAGSSLGIKWSEESKQKCSILNKDRAQWHSDRMKKTWSENREYLLKCIKDKCNDKEYRKSLSENHKLKNISAGENNPNFGKKNLKLSKFNKEIKSKSIIQMDLFGNFINLWYSVREAARELKIDRSAIRRMCDGKTIKNQKFIFKYKTNE